MRKINLIHQKKYNEKGVCSVMVKKDFQGTKTARKSSLVSYVSLLVYRMLNYSLGDSHWCRGNFFPNCAKSKMNTITQFYLECAECYLVTPHDISVR